MECKIRESCGYKISAKTLAAGVARGYVTSSILASLNEKLSFLLHSMSCLL